MRKSKIITIEGRGEVTVKEISPAALYSALRSGSVQGELAAIADECLTPGFDEVSKWYASEIELIVDAFLEVNSSFFGVAAKLRLDGMLAEMLTAMQKSLPEAFAGSFAQVMSGHGITDGKSL